jgi:hypothetical protein
MRRTTQLVGFDVHHASTIAETPYDLGAGGAGVG